MGDADILHEAMADDGDRPDTATAEGLDHAEERAQGFLRAAADSMLRADAKELMIMPVSFDQIVVGKTYSRNELANLWGYASMHAIARGVVTPRDDNKIILFVTREKQAGSEQYEDELSGRTLWWEGPKDHFAEDRMLAAARTGDEIHLFYRERHHTDFVYHGKLDVVRHERHSNRPSRFVFAVR